MSDVSLSRGPTHFLCAICFDSVLYEEAYIDADGGRWDMCPFCGAQEAWMERELAAGRRTRPSAAKTWTSK